MNAETQAGGNPTVTVAELNKLLEQYVRLDAEKEALEAQVTEKNKELATVEGRVTAYLKELGQDEFNSPLAKCEIVEKWRVNLPAGDIAKKEFFDHLRERGIFDKYATVQSNSLNALYFRDQAEYVRQGGDPMLFSMPGIGAPKVHVKTDIKLKKGVALA